MTELSKLSYPKNKYYFEYKLAGINLYQHIKKK